MPLDLNLDLPDLYTPEEKEYIQTGRSPTGIVIPPSDKPATLPPSSTLDKPAVERQKGKESPFKNPEFLGLLLAGLGDVIGSLSQGKPSTTALESTMKIQDARRKQKAEQRLGETEERKAKSEETRTQILQSAENRQLAQLQLTSSKELIKEASDFASTVTMLPDAEATKLRAAFRNRALPLGPDVVDTVQAIMTQPEIGKIAGPYTEYLPASLGPFQTAKTAMLIRDGKASEAIDELRGLSASNVMTAYRQRVAGIATQLKGQYGEKKIPLSVVEAALGGRSDLPLLELHRGAEGIWAKPGYKEWVSGTLEANGIELPGLAAKVQEAKASETARKEAAQPFEKTAEEKAREAGLIEAAKQRVAEGKKLTKEQANQRMSTLAQDFSRLEMGKGLNPIELMQATILAKDDPEVARRIKLGDPQIVEYSKQILRSEMERLSKEYQIPLPKYPGVAPAPGAQKTPGKSPPKVLGIERVP